MPRQENLTTTTSRKAGSKESAKESIAFANAADDHLLTAIEDGQKAPPADHKIPESSLAGGSASWSSTFDTSQSLFIARWSGQVK
ncbi:hypothetical protein EMIT0P253_170047 [Pseudomonas sp. IT-P253]